MVITQSIEYSSGPGGIVVVLDIFHQVHLNMVAPTTDCKWQLAKMSQPCRALLDLIQLCVSESSQTGEVGVKSKG